MLSLGAWEPGAPSASASLEAEPETCSRLGDINTRAVHGQSDGVTSRVSGRPHHIHPRRREKVSVAVMSSARGGLCQGLAVLWVPPAGGNLCLVVWDMRSRTRLPEHEHGRFHKSSPPQGLPVGVRPRAMGASLRAVGGLEGCPALCMQPLLPGGRAEHKATPRPPGPGPWRDWDRRMSLGTHTLSPEGRGDGPWRRGVVSADSSQKQIFLPGIPGLVLLRHITSLQPSIQMGIGPICEYFIRDESKFLMLKTDSNGGRGKKVTEGLTWLQA